MHDRDTTCPAAFEQRLRDRGVELVLLVRAEQIARATPGVIAVKNALLASTTLTARVAAALAEDPRTALAPIDVSSSGGTVPLIGQVPSVEMREAAEQIARTVRGVALVINDLEVCPHDLEVDPMVPACLAMPHEG